jgi:transcriptional regulator with XRE-family HTH domain
MSKNEFGQGRKELADGLSRRLVELRRRAGMTQQGVADAMGRSRAGNMPAGRLERGGVQSASLLTVAEYLRAVRAGFSDLKDVLDRYTSLPIPEPVQKLAEAAPPPRLTASARTCENGDSPSERSDARYSPRFPERRELRSRNPKQEPDLEVLRVRRRAGYWVLRKVFEYYLHDGLNTGEIPATSGFRRSMAAYGRRVFNAYFRTRGKKESKRVERLARLREWTDRHHFDRTLAEYMELLASLAFEDMHQRDELDWMPPPEEAFAIMAVKPKHRVVTDFQMCLAGWADVSSRYNAAFMAIYERPHKAALDVADSARCDARTLIRYRGAALRAANIARTTAPATPRRKRSINDWRATDWPEEMDRRLLERMLAAALATWDALLPTLPPAPGPRPV